MNQICGKILMYGIKRMTNKKNERRGLDMSKVEDVMAAVKLNDLLKKKDEEVEEKANKKVLKTILIVCGIVVIAAAVAGATAASATAVTGYCRGNAAAYQAGRPFPPYLM